MHLREWTERRQINLIIFFIEKIQKNILKPIRGLSHKFKQKIEGKKIL